MARNKKEEDFKLKLEVRKISPSDEAWKQLQNRLEAEGKPKRINYLWISAIAATVIGVLLVSRFVLKTNSIVVPSTIVVEQEPVKTESESEIFKPESNRIIAEDKMDAVKLNKVQEKKNEDNKLRIEKNTIAELEEERNNKVKESEEHLSGFYQKSSADLQTKISELARVKNTAVTDQYLDSLLDRAQKDIAVHGAKAAKKNVVDSKSLLESVEYDIEDSFREKVFDVVKAGFVKVKTAVVTRNH